MKYSALYYVCVYGSLDTVTKLSSLVDMKKEIKSCVYYQNDVAAFYLILLNKQNGGKILNVLSQLYKFDNEFVKIICRKNNLFKEASYDLFCFILDKLKIELEFNDLCEIISSQNYKIIKKCISMNYLKISFSLFDDIKIELSNILNKNQNLTDHEKNKIKSALYKIIKAPIINKNTIKKWCDDISVSVGTFAMNLMIWIIYVIIATKIISIIMFKS